MARDRDELTNGDPSLDRVVGVGRAIVPADLERFDPPTGLWDAIASHLGETAGHGSTDVPDTPVVIEPDIRDDSHLAPVVPLAGRSRTKWVLAAAAAVLLVAAIAGVVINRQDTKPNNEVVAATQLKVLEGSATAEATLVRSDGKLSLRIIAHDMPAPPDGNFYELWLVDPKITDPQPIGEMSGSTELKVPSSIDVTKFPVVDISLQPNGMHHHSGHSLLRGTLA